MVARELRSPRYEDARVHFMHLSASSRSRRSRRPRQAASRVSAEVTPHHLTLTDEVVRTLDSRLQDEPAAAHRTRPPRADRRAPIGTDRLRRHRPRAALARGEGGAVRGGAVRHHRARDGVRRALHRARAARRARRSTIVLERMSAGRAHLRPAGPAIELGPAPTSCWSISTPSWRGRRERLRSAARTTAASTAGRSTAGCC